MNFPLLGPIGKIIKIAGSILGVDSVKDVVDAISNNKLTPEQKLQLEQAVLEHESEMRQFQIEELKTVMSESLAMIQSQDKFTSRARPALLYLAGLITTALAVAKIFGVEVNSDVIWLIGPMWGQAGWYTWNRTKEKMNGHNSE